MIITIIITIIISIPVLILTMNLAFAVDYLTERVLSQTTKNAQKL